MVNGIVNHGLASSLWHAKETAKNRISNFDMPAYGRPFT
jgi:hypothetical protein